MQEFANQEPEITTELGDTQEFAEPVYVVLEYQQRHMEISLMNRMVELKRIISPTRGGEWFPNGYFDKRTVTVDDHVFEQLQEQLQICLRSLPFRKEAASIPPGASYDAYLRILGRGMETYEYTTTAWSAEGTCLESTSVHEAFLELYELVSSQIDFPDRESDVRMEPAQEREIYDSRYFEETLWMCEKCGAGNLLENRKCVKCGAARG